ncbi:MAG: sigma-70 family RNA polymerase sigma factor [Hyphomicrobiaceae bacterium]|nr:sigma-70 family RNA polymerase sigma factor [Hyphomicrobiaceae bacterium]
MTPPPDRPGTPDRNLDHALIAVARNRDVAAFELVFRHYAPKVRAFMLKRAAAHAEAEELMQETMTKVWKEAARFDPEKGSVSGWIFTIARNVRIDAVRKTKRPEFDPDDPALVPTPVATADEVLDHNEDARRLGAAMKVLPAEQLELIRLSFFEDMPHGQIAEKLALPLGTVKSRIRLAFAKLRDALGDQR